MNYFGHVPHDEYFAEGRTGINFFHYIDVRSNFPDGLFRDQEYEKYMEEHELPVKKTIIRGKVC